MTLRKFTKLALFISLIAIAAAGLACKRSKAENNNVAATPATVIEVTTTPAILRQLPRYFEATGSLAANEQTDVAPSTSGKVSAIGVEMGSYVRRGQMIVRLDDNDNRIRLQQAQAQLDQARATLRQNEAKIGLRPGQKFNPANVPEVAAARASLDLAEKNLRRHEKLVESGDVSRAAYDQQRSVRDVAREQYEVAIHQAQQNYAGVANAQGAVDAAQTAVALAKRTLDYTVITSPMNGYVSERDADLGEYVSPQQKVATIVNLNPLRVRIDIPEQAISRVHVGESVSVTVAAYTDRTFAGHIARISPNVTATSRTLTVEAEVQNPNAVLKPGQFASVRILLPQSEPAVLVPQRALRTISGATYVFILKNGHAEQRLVQTGQAESDLVEIKSGVVADELVATSNVDQLSDGIAVRQ
jgi:multidrug efflux pump subunit AcrA (membrane-fusion protein)